MKQSWETMTFVSAGQIILTPTQPVGSGRAATAEIEPGTSSPGVARSTDWATAPRQTLQINISDSPVNDTLH